MRVIFKERNIAIMGGSICYYVTGNHESAICMVFLNGLFHGKESWVKQQRTPFFYKQYKMIFIDYRGAGKSTFSQKEFSFPDIVDDIRKVIEFEKPKKTILVGYSVGGLIAMYYTYLFHHEVPGLILLNTGININIHTSKMLNGVVSFLNQGISLKEVLMFVIPWNHSANYLEKIYDYEEIVRENYNEYNKNTGAFINFLQSIKSRPDMQDLPEKIKPPVLIIGSNNDCIFPISFQKDLHDKMPNSQFRVINDCGHASFIEKDMEVNSYMIDFLKNCSFDFHNS